jgi:Tfp pilus assembly protein PilN
MSKQQTTPSLVIEWSSRGLRTYDALNGTSGQTLDGLSGREAVLALGRRTAFLKTAFLPSTSEADLRLIVQMRAAEFLPLPGDQIAFSVNPTAQLAEGGRLSQIGAVAINELRAAMSQLATAGIKVKLITIAAVGSEKLAATNGFSNVAVVQQTSDGIAVDIIAEGTLRYSRVVSPGSDLEGEICRTFTVAGQPCGSVIAAGGLPYPDADRGISNHSLESLANAAWPSLVIELPEAREKREKEAKQSVTRQALLLGAATLALGVYAYSDWDEKQVAENKEKSRYASRIKKLEAAKKVIEADLTKATTLESALQRAFQPAQKFSDVIKVITSEVPAKVWLSGITVERGKQLQLRGTAMDGAAVADYVRRLTGQRRFRDVKLVFANNAEIDKKPVVQFSISAFPVGNLPVVEPPKGRGVKK